MKAVRLIAIAVIIMLMLACFFAGRVSSSIELNTWKLLVDLGTIIGGVGALGAMSLAFVAVNDWKHQLREQIAIDSAIELEDLVTTFYMACLGDIEKVKSHPDLQVHSKAILLCFRLRRRKYHVKEVQDFENALTNIVDSMMKKDIILDRDMDNLLLSMNNFSKKVTR